MNGVHASGVLVEGATERDSLSLLKPFLLVELMMLLLDIEQNWKEN